MANQSQLSTELGGVLLSALDHNNQTYDIRDLEASRVFSGADGTSRNSLLVTVAGTFNILSTQSGLNLVSSAQSPINYILPGSPVLGYEYIIYTYTNIDTLASGSSNVLLAGVVTSAPINLVANSTYLVFYNGTEWLVNLASSSLSPTTLQSGSYNTSIDYGGAANNIVGEFSPTITVYTKGQILSITNILFTNTGGVNLHVGVSGSLPIVSAGNTPLPANSIIAGSTIIVQLSYSLTYWNLIYSSGVELFAALNGNNTETFNAAPAGTSTEVITLAQAETLSTTGNAATATTATNLSGGTVNATTGVFSGQVTVPAATASTSAVNLAQLGNYNNFIGLIDIATPQTLPDTAYGAIVQVTAASAGLVVTLPTGENTGAAWGKIDLYNDGLNPFTVSPNSTQFIYCPACGLNSPTGGAGSFVMQPGDRVSLACRGNEFDIVGGSWITTNLLTESFNGRVLFGGVTDNGVDAIQTTTGAFSGQVTVPAATASTSAVNLGQSIGNNGYVTISPANGTIYTNSNNRPILVTVTINSARTTTGITVAGVQIAEIQTNDDAAGVGSIIPYSFIVPPLQTYEFTGNSAFNLAFYL